MEKLPEPDNDSQPNGSPSPNVLKVILAFRMWGWIGVWFQIVLGVISSIILLLAGTRNVSQATNVNPANNPGTIPGLGFAWIALLVLVIGIFWNFRYTQISKKLRSAEERPSRAQTVKTLKIGIVISLVGMLITLVGAFAIVGSLTGKSLTPQAQTLGLQIITVQPIDMLVVQSNTNIILAHFGGLITSLWLLNKITDKVS